MSKIAFAIHGGAGTISRTSLGAKKEKQYQEALLHAVNAGFKMLEKGGTALDAVNFTVKMLEDNDLFNAGKGSVLNSEGKVEMDASIMDGKTLQAGAVAGVKNIRNPIDLARAVMEKSGHVLMSGKGAVDFGLGNGFEFEKDEYFFCQERYDQWLKAKANNSIFLDHTDDKKYGTVGAVALDRTGNLAAATSTGGMTNKMFGRVGDTPIVGAGVYANNDTCAVSCTGHGEYFLRRVVAYDISCLIEYKGLSLKEATTLVVLEKLKQLGGVGGVISVDKFGNVELVFNSQGMYRAWKKEGEEAGAAIWE